METTKNEYENENNRTSVIDTKVSIALPIISGYFLAIAPMNNYKSIFSAKILTFSDCIIPTLLFVTYSVSLILALISVIDMVKVITTRAYNRLNPRDLYNDNFMKYDERVLSIQLIKLYINATEKNKSVNDNRIPLYKSGWLLTTISIISFVIYVIIKNFFT